MEADALVRSFDSLSVDSAQPVELFERLPREVLEIIFDKSLANEHGHKSFREAFSLCQVSSALWPRQTE